MYVLYICLFVGEMADVYLEIYEYHILKCIP